MHFFYRLIACLYYTAITINIVNLHSENRSAHLALPGGHPPAPSPSLTHSELVPPFHSPVVPSGSPGRKADPVPNLGQNFKKGTLFFQLCSLLFSWVLYKLLVPKTSGDFQIHGALATNSWLGLSILLIAWNCSACILCLHWCGTFTVIVGPSGWEVGVW